MKLMSGRGWTKSRLPRARICVGIAMLCTITSVLAQEVFKHLSAAEIKKTITGKVVTDGPHWADSFARDGTVESVMQGQAQKGRWSVRGNNLCLAYASAKTEECYEVWRYGQMIEYRRDGVLVAQGKLVNQ